MKSKILAKLQAKYPGLPKQLLGQVAEKLATTVTEDTGIDDAITALDNLPLSLPDYARLLQQEGDRRFADGRRQSQPNDNPDDELDDENDPKPGNKQSQRRRSDDAITKLTSLVETLTNEVTSLKKGEQQKTFNQQLLEKMAEKKIPAVLLKGRVVEKAEDIDTVLAEIEADHNSYKQELVNQGFSANTIPGGGNTVNAEKTKVEADIGSWADSHKPSQTQAKS